MAKGIGAAGHGAAPSARRRRLAKVAELKN